MTLHRRTLLAAAAVVGVAGCTERLLSQDSTEETAADTEQVPAEDDDVDPEPEPAPPNEPREYDPLFDFRDLSPWESGGGDLSEDPENYLTGEQAVRIDVDTGETWARIERSGLDLDLSERRLNLVCRVHLPKPGGQPVDVM